MSTFWHFSLGVLAACMLAAGCVRQSDQETERKNETEDSTTGKSTDGEEQPRYTLKLQLIDLGGHFRVKINGFPVEEPSTMVRMSGSDVTAYLNTALIGKRNDASVSVMPFLTRAEKRLDIGTVKMTAKVKRGESVVGRISEAEVDSTYRAWSERAMEAIFEAGRELATETSGQQLGNHGPRRRRARLNATVDGPESDGRVDDVRQRGGAGLLTDFRGGAAAAGQARHAGAPQRLRNASAGFDGPEGHLGPVRGVSALLRPAVQDHRI